ncbi:glycosyltransferase family 4 protein, partial [Candidatus Pacearchaeota archaeon CG10_big_fil_rev_8_21_14_0_10_30_48]
NGYLIKDGNKKEFAKKIILLLTDKKLYRHMSENTLKEIKKHDINKIINEWEKTYNQLVK